MMNVRSFACLAAILFPAALCIPRSSGADIYKFTLVDLGTLGGSTSSATAVSNSGPLTVAGWADIAGNANQHAFMWQNGAPKDLGTLWKDNNGTSLGNSWAYGVNGHGQVVGQSETADIYNGLRVTHAFLYSGNAMKDLNPPGSHNSRASAINDNGVVVISADNFHSYSYSGNAFTDLGFPQGVGLVAAVGITNAGMVAASGNDSNTTYSYVGRINFDWTAPGAPPGYDKCYATGVADDPDPNGNPNADLVGNALLKGDAHHHAFLYSNPNWVWNGAGWHSLGALPGDLESVVNGTNNGDLAVGYSQQDVFNGTPRAVLYRWGTKIFDLVTLVQNNPGWTLKTANAINDADDIVGQGNHNFVTHAFLLQPAPRTSRSVQPPFPYWLLSGMNGSGQGAGYGSDGAGFSHALFYSHGTTTDLGKLPGDTDAAAFGLNDSAQIVGVSSHYDAALGTVGTAFLQTGSVMQSLGGLGGYYSQANAINNAGQVTGFASMPNPVLGTVNHAFRYSSGSMQDLGTLPGYNHSFGKAINGGGQVAGLLANWVLFGEIRGYYGHAFVYSGGTLNDLGTLGGEYSQANAVNGPGHVAGWAQPAGTTSSHACLWKGTSPIDLGTILSDDAGYSSANAVNGLDEVAGYSVTRHGGQHAVIANTDMMLDLNAFVPAGSGIELNSATGINDAGQVCGYATQTTSSGPQTVGFILSPIRLIGLKISPSIVAGCKNATGKVTLSDPAPASGVVISLQSTNSAATVPLSIVVRPGYTTAAFVIHTVRVTARIEGTITAGLGDDQLSAALAVRPDSVQSVTVTPNPITGSQTGLGTVTVECVAPSGGFVVSLTSSNPSVASVPATATVPAGATSATFSVPTAAVTAVTRVTITASLNGLSKKSALTLNP